jgi:hypothetical protein
VKVLKKRLDNKSTDDSTAVATTVDIPITESNASLTRAMKRLKKKQSAMIMKGNDAQTNGKRTHDTMIHSDVPSQFNSNLIHDTTPSDHADPNHDDHQPMKKNKLSYYHDTNKKQRKKDFDKKRHEKVLKRKRKKSSSS